MLTLNDGRTELWQWDTGRTLAVDADCSQVHFSNKVFGRSIDVDVIDGVAIIPDILLQTDKELNVWAFVGTAENGYTKISKTFKVNRRNKPADYVFTPVEQTTIAEIAAIAQSVRDDADAGLFDGAQGPEGPIGQVGPKGEKGDTGATGATGASGEDGKSAYQYAQDGGYTGTEAEFAAKMAQDIPTVDSTLTKSGQAADAAVVGNRLSALSKEIANLPGGGSGLTTAQITALDGLFKIAAYTEDASTAYSAFKVAFGLDGGGTGVTLSSISATYIGGDVAVGTALSDLTGIVVTAQYSDGSTATVTGYTLSGEIAEGSNTITVTYQDKTATFTVTGTAAAQVYTVTNNLTNVTNSNAQTEVTDGFYSATLTVADGNVLNSITITRGGVDIPDGVYGDGRILISEVTGDIVITAVAGKTILYQLSGTPKSVAGLSEDTGIAFGASDANGYVKTLTICIAYNGFGANETLMKMSSGSALIFNSNGASQTRLTCCSNGVNVYPGLSETGDSRIVIAKDAKSEKTISVYTLSSGEVKTVSIAGTYGNFKNSVCAGNLLVGSGDITVNNFTIYEGILSSADIAAFLSGGDI